jgi:hypothetical protein
MASRDLSEARKAARNVDIAASRAAHMIEVKEVGSNATPEMRTATETHKKGGDRMKTCLFGGLDGIVTTFAVVAGAGGGGLSVSVVLIMGFSSLVADALSMGVGDALSSKAESEVAVRERLREAWELEKYGAPRARVRSRTPARMHTRQMTMNFYAAPTLIFRCRPLSLTLPRTPRAAATPRARSVRWSRSTRRRGWARRMPRRL